MSHYTVMVIGPDPETQLAPYEEGDNSGKWDWYVLGGRWTGFFKLKPGASGGTGRAGMMTQPAKDGYADIALKKNIDFAWMRKQARDAAAKAYDRVREILDKYPAAQTWKNILAKHPGNTDSARVEYYGQPAILAIQEAEIMSIFSDPIEEFSIPKEKYLHRAECRAVASYAFVRDGKWVARGEMGWFGMSSDEMDENEWHEKVNALLDELPEDTLISLYDCHI